jgi:hypothetical protein
VSNKLLTRWKWILVALAAVPAIHFYYIQEMIAALIILSVLFVGVSVLVLLVFLLDRGSEKIIVPRKAGLVPCRATM